MNPKRKIEQAEKDREALWATLAAREAEIRRVKKDIEAIYESIVPTRGIRSPSDDRQFAAQAECIRGYQEQVKDLKAGHDTLREGLRKGEAVITGLIDRHLVHVAGLEAEILDLKTRRPATIPEVCRLIDERDALKIKRDDLRAYADKLESEIQHLKNEILGWRDDRDYEARRAEGFLAALGRSEAGNIARHAEITRFRTVIGRAGLSL